jgi:hypothetical protein
MLGLERTDRMCDQLSRHPCGRQIVRDECVARAARGQGLGSPLGEATVVDQPRSRERRERLLEGALSHAARGQLALDLLGAAVTMAEQT